MITTKKGDGGETSLYDGTRVSKDDARIELNGELDELNAWIGLCKATLQQTEPYEHIQRELMMVMAVVANGYQRSGATHDSAQVLDALEAATNQMEDMVMAASRSKQFEFVLPGKNEVDGLLHLARTKVRTCERRLVSVCHLHTADEQERRWEVLKRYLNRLSDYLFCLCNR